MSPINRFHRSLEEDGIYVLATRRWGLFVSRFRNRMLARKFGVKKINIGARSNLQGLACIELGEDFVAQDGLWLHAITRYYDQSFTPRIVIGNRVRISQWVHIAATNCVEIGDDVLIGSKVMITDHNHGQYSRQHTSPRVAPASRPLDRDLQVLIGKNVWLGDGVVVAPGSSIGEGAVIAANSVVRGSIPAFSMAAGVPAKIVKCYDFSAQKWVRVE